MLSVDSNHKEECDNGIFLWVDTDFTATLSFYANEQWNRIRQQPYIIGEDFIYGQIDTNLYSSSFQDLSIDAVYVCTDPSSETEGCLSPVVGAGPYVIINNEDGTRHYRGHSFYDTEEDQARFSFRAFGMFLFHRDYIHFLFRK